MVLFIYTSKNLYLFKFLYLSSEYSRLAQSCFSGPLLSLMSSCQLNDRNYMPWALNNLASAAGLQHLKKLKDISFKSYESRFATHNHHDLFKLTLYYSKWTEEDGPKILEKWRRRREQEKILFYVKFWKWSCFRDRKTREFSLTRTDIQKLMYCKKPFFTKV